MSCTDVLSALVSGFTHLTWQSAFLILLGCVLLYLAVAKGFEPLLLIPIGFGVILGNLPLAGLEFVITGRLEALTRQEAEARIKSLGGKASSDVTRKTSYLVAGADPGSKLARAAALEIKTLNEAEFLQLLNRLETKSEEATHS